MLEQFLSKFFKATMADYCDIETSLRTDPDDDFDSGSSEVLSEHILVQRDGSLTTFISLEGSYKTLGARQRHRMFEQLTHRLSGIMRAPGTRIQFYLSRDPDANERALKEALRPSAVSAKRIGLDLGGVLSERARVLSGKVAQERCVIAITTQLSVFSGSQLKDALRQRMAVLKEAGMGLKMGAHGQSPMMAVRALRETHVGFIIAFRNILSEYLLTRLMTDRDAIRMLGAAINPSAFSHNWKPILPGDRVPVRLVRESRSAADISHLQYPDIAYQLFPQGPSIDSEDPSLVNMGPRVIAPLVVDIPPQRPSDFSELFKAIPQDVPFHIMITIETGHDRVVSKIGQKKAAATFLALTSGQSKSIQRAAEEILHYAEDGSTLVMASVGLCTWGEDKKTTIGRKAILRQAVQSWGNLQAIDEKGDSIWAWLGTLPAMSARAAGNRFPWFLEEMLPTLPLGRPTSPWEKGAFTFRTLDNKPFPMQPGSSMQTNSVDLIFAPPGFGKSLFLAAQNTALILSPGRQKLPRMAILDVGYSSASFINMLKSALPENMQHQVESFRMTLSRKNAINPFDTPLGCRRPLAVDLPFLVNFMTLVLTPASSKEGIPRLAELVTYLIDAMYDKLSDKGDPNMYDENFSEVVDKAIEKNALPSMVGKSWWEVTDALAACHDYHAAGIAQSFAVPLLSDATTVLKGDHRIRDTFGSAQWHGESLMDFLSGMVVSAVGEYPLLSAPTTFDAGEARVVSINLQDIARSGGDQARKRSAIAYMLARNALCREFYRDMDTLDEIPQAYRSYHAKRIEEESSMPKKLCFDEFHRTEGVDEVRQQALVDIREGRKFKVQITIASQLLDDFPDDMVKNANNVWILSKGLDEGTVDEIRQRFKPSEDAMADLERYVTGPGPEGSSFLYLGELKGGGRVEQVLRLTLGPREIWAYSTTPEDVGLRTALSNELGMSKALAILARNFPSGSAASFLERKGLSAQDDDEVGFELIQKIAEELIEEDRRISAAGSE